MEMQGSGLKNICDETEAAANYSEDFKPEFYSDHGQFTVTLWNMNYNDNAHQDMTEKETDRFTEKFAEKFTEKLSDRETQIIKLIEEKPEYTTTEMANILSVSRMSVSKYIYSLKEKKLIERIGSDRKGYWKITR